MQRAKDRQRDSETQIAQGHELVQAASLGDLILRRQYSDHEEGDTGGAHCDLGARDFEERGENSLAHRFPDLVDSFRKVATPNMIRFCDQDSSRAPSNTYPADVSQSMTS